MICFYGITLVGTSHLTKGIVCQDAHNITQVNEWTIASIADGVGSSKHSEIASKIAVETVAFFCKNELNENSTTKDIEEILVNSFKEAQNQIENKANIDGNSITEYDTTLSTVIYNGKTVVYAHSGDGGIVGLCKNGKYIKITTPQKADDGVCVIPLRAGENSWAIGHCDLEIVSVLLATDGIYDNFFPYLLRGLDIEVYVPLIRYFMDNEILKITKENQLIIQNDREKFLKSDACNVITDDKTVVVLVNNASIAEQQPESYYSEPNWVELQEMWNRKAYPHLYNKEINISKGE